MTTADSAASAVANADHKPIILVDGSSFLFRAYHAIRQPLATADGRTTHAAFGTINMLRSLTREYKPARLAVVMDAGGATFRSEMYGEYKANRPPMPDDLRAQLGYVRDLVSALGIALISVPGVEADDVIGTLATRASAADLHTLIVSSDKDLAQLVCARVSMLDTMKNVRLDVAGVTEKFGVSPGQIIDYLALVGDASDNVPGVPGVGAKTAVKWLAEFGGLSQIVKRADEIGGKVGESLRANLSQLELAQKLVTLKCDVDLKISLDDLRPQPPDTEKLRALYTDLEFRSWLKQLDGDGAITKTKNENETPPDYETITDAKTLKRWLGKLKKSTLFALDTETTSKDAHRAELVGLSFSVAANEAAYLPLRHRYAGAPQQLSFDETIKKLRPILEDAKQAKTGQNLKYDKQVLQYHGIELRGITDDTMLMSYLLDAGASGGNHHDMDTLARKHLQRETIKFSAVAGSGKKQLTFDQIDIEQATKYAAEDADVTLQIASCVSTASRKKRSVTKTLSRDGNAVAGSVGAHRK